MILLRQHLTDMVEGHCGRSNCYLDVDLSCCVQLGDALLACLYARTSYRIVYDGICTNSETRGLI